MSKVFSWKKCKWLYLSITFEALYCVLSTTITICRQKQTKFWHFLMYLIVFFDSIKNHFGRINRNCLFTFLRVNNQLHFHEIIKVLVCFLWDQTDELHLNILHVFHKKRCDFTNFYTKKKSFEAQTPLIVLKTTVRYLHYSLKEGVAKWKTKNILFWVFFTDTIFSESRTEYAW